MKPINLRVAEELGVREQQVAAAVSLLDGGATVPFVARYRKEATGALDDTQLRTLEERLRYLRELDERRAAVLESIRAQGKLDDELAARILEADSKARLEDIYLPYKPKRRTKAQIAREAGLEPLADTLLADPSQDPAELAANFLPEAVADAAAAPEGARSILGERFAEDARPTSGWPTPSAGRGAPASKCTWVSTCAPGCGRPPRTAPSTCSPATCVTCCSPPPPAPAPPWAWTPACAPASRSPSSTPPASP